MIAKSKSDFRERFHQDVKNRFVNDVNDHVVQQLHRDGDVVKLWRCGKPESSVYMFCVCSAPNCLIVYGDMGECMWQRHYDMIPFVRGSAESLSYFSEKVPADLHDSILEYKSELAMEWFEGIREEWIECGGEWGDEHEIALQDCQDAFDDDRDSFRNLENAIADSIFYSDCDDMPNLRWYTHHYLWIVEGLKWFVEKLDANEVEGFGP